jgi:hypothetical protein
LIGRALRPHGGSRGREFGAAGVQDVRAIGSRVQIWRTPITTPIPSVTLACLNPPCLRADAVLYTSLTFFSSQVFFVLGRARSDTPLLFPHSPGAQAPALAVMCPLLIKGLKEETPIKRKAANIISNMSKLVTSAADADAFLPKLLPRLEVCWLPCFGCRTVPQTCRTGR